MKYLIGFLLCIFALPAITGVHTGDDVRKLKNLQGNNLVHYCHHGLVYVGSYRTMPSSRGSLNSKIYYTRISNFMDNETQKQMSCSKYDELELKRILAEVNQNKEEK